MRQLPTTNFQLPRTSNSQLPVSFWELGIGLWELTRSFPALSLQHRSSLVMAVALVMSAGLVPLAQTQPPAGQTPPPPPATQEGVPQPPPNPEQGEHRGPPRPNFPQQQRKLADAAVIARGKGLYESNCAACHGIDLRGGQQGGPNLLRSQLVLGDKDGEQIMPVVQRGRPNPRAGAPPMPPFPLPPDDIKAIAEYFHSVLALAGAQGRPPEGEVVPPERVLVGDAAAGQAYFSATCATCHSVDGDLKALASRVRDPRELQDLWVSGGRGRGGRGADAEGGDTMQRQPVTVTVTPASGPPLEGRLVRVDDFTVSLILADGTRKTFVRTATGLKVVVHDPAEAHRKLVSALAEKDMHNVTAYLWTLR
jgi:cytochrome c oxidase cbb3-type subunit III